MQKQIEIPQRPFKEVSEIRSVHMSKGKSQVLHCVSVTNTDTQTVEGGAYGPVRVYKGVQAETWVGRR